MSIDKHLPSTSLMLCHKEVNHCSPKESNCLFDQQPSSPCSSSSQCQEIRDDLSEGTVIAAATFHAPFPLVGDDKKCVTCSFCNKVFASQWYLKQHAVTHSCERPYKCSTCSKSYRFRSNLYQHKCSNINNKPAIVVDTVTEITPNKVNQNHTSPKHSLLSSNNKVTIKLESNDYVRPVVSALSSTSLSPGGHPMVEPQKINCFNSNKETVVPTSTLSSRIAITKPTAVIMAPPMSCETASVVQVPSTITSSRNPVADCSKSSSCSITIERLRNAAVKPMMSHESTLPLTVTTKPVPLVFSDDLVASFLEENRSCILSCAKCHVYFPTTEYLRQHESGSHNAKLESRVHCLHCSEHFASDERYARHKTNHVPQSSHLCSVCRGRFVSRLALRRHSLKCCHGTREVAGGMGSTLWHRLMGLPLSLPPVPVVNGGDLRSARAAMNLNSVWHANNSPLGGYSSPTSRCSTSSLGGGGVDSPALTITGSMTSISPTIDQSQAFVSVAPMAASCASSGLSSTVPLHNPFPPPLKAKAKRQRQPRRQQQVMKQVVSVATGPQQSKLKIQQKCANSLLDYRASSSSSLTSQSNLAMAASIDKVIDSVNARHLLSHPSPTSSGPSPELGSSSYSKSSFGRSLGSNPLVAIMQTESFPTIKLENDANNRQLLYDMTSSHNDCDLDDAHHIMSTVTSGVGVGHHQQLHQMPAHTSSSMVLTQCHQDGLDDTNNDDDLMLSALSESGVYDASLLDSFAESREMTSLFECSDDFVTAGLSAVSNALPLPPLSVPAGAVSTTSSSDGNDSLLSSGVVPNLNASQFDWLDTSSVMVSGGVGPMPNSVAWSSNSGPDMSSRNAHQSQLTSAAAAMPFEGAHSTLLVTEGESMTVLSASDLDMSYYLGGNTTNGEYTPGIMQPPLPYNNSNLLRNGGRSMLHQQQVGGQLSQQQAANVYMKGGGGPMPPSQPLNGMVRYQQHQPPPTGYYPSEQGTGYFNCNSGIEPQFHMQGGGGSNDMNMGPPSHTSGFHDTNSIPPLAYQHSIATAAVQQQQQQLLMQNAPHSTPNVRTKGPAKRSKLVKQNTNNPLEMGSVLGNTIATTLTESGLPNSNVPQPQFKCPECSRELKSQRSLKRHTLIHTRPPKQRGSSSNNNGHLDQSTEPQQGMGNGPYPMPHHHPLIPPHSINNAAIVDSSPPSAAIQHSGATSVVYSSSNNKINSHVSTPMTTTHKSSQNQSAATSTPQLLHYQAPQQMVSTEHHNPGVFMTNSATAPPGNVIQPAPRVISS